MGGRTKMKITSKTKISKTLDLNPKAAEILFESGLHCVGCPAVSEESLEDGCKAHGMNKKQIENLIKKLNKREK